MGSIELERLQEQLAEAQRTNYALDPRCRELELRLTNTGKQRDELQAECAKWKAKADEQYQLGLRDGRERAEGAAEWASTEMKRASDLADALMIAESDRDNYLRLWQEMSAHWDDLRRYIGSKLCAKYDQLRAKKR